MLKSENAMKTIGEVADMLSLEPSVLRYWETQFTQIKPLKRRNGRRYYRPEDVALLKQIQQLLHERKFTIKGAKKALRERPSAQPPTIANTSPSTEKSSQPTASNNTLQSSLRQIHNSLTSLKQSIIRESSATS